MSDYIKRSDAIKVLREHVTFEFAEDEEWAVTLLQNLPSADRPQGEWIEDYNNTYSRCRMKCSACGKFSGIGGIKSNQRKPFCPNCGARMKGADDEA